MEKRPVRLGVLTAGLCLLLSGCFFRGVHELYAIPQPPKDYEALQARLSEVVAQGGEYAAPLTGEMIQSVQLQDLDGDGNQEAIAFFRLPSEEKPLKIYIFRPVGEEYETLAVIEGAGTAINSVDYVQMDEDPFKEVVVSWQMTAQVHSLAAYSVSAEQVEELIRTDYDSYQIVDLDQDNQQELLVFRTPIGDVPQAEYYDFDGVLDMAGVAPLSTGAYTGPDGAIKSSYLQELQSGYLADRIPAAFATSSYGGNGTITDIFAIRDGKLCNVTLDPETGESGETVRYYTQVSQQDINGDGIVELPQPVPLLDYRISADTVSFWLIHWRQFDIQGQAQQVFTTYHNDRDGWYFILPEAWENNVTLSRSDLPGGGERSVTFSYWTGEEGVDPLPFLTIYKLAGTNRISRAKAGERFLLYPLNALDRPEEASTIYAAEFRGGWDCGLTQEQVRERFAIIRTDWYAG
ncbi:MAG: hypothetical protein HFF05_01085 [Oscillospiraceae bacterium]|nr:hypothetical protein [Oscillospiraceae bacterium]